MLQLGSLPVICSDVSEASLVAENDQVSSSFSSIKTSIHLVATFHDLKWIIYICWLNECGYVRINIL